MEKIIYSLKLRKDLNSMTFTTWLKRNEGFISRAQYDSLLNNLPYEAQRKVTIYYKEKYRYFLDTEPKQTEIEFE
ncbi:hypothetical protein DIC82_18045 [Clostridium beijerinckii]|nr:hypothetical protein DIC82_18045 [Clostridium beijerinckii]